MQAAQVPKLLCILSVLDVPRTRPRVALSRVLHEHARISPNLAVRLEAAGAGTARAWLAMQSAHDLAAERASGSPEVRRLNDGA